MQLKPTLDRLVSLIQEQQWIGAQALGLDLLQAYPGQVDALDLMGVIAYETHNFSEALHFFKTAYHRLPHAPYLTRMGMAYLQLNQIDLALESFEKSRQSSPKEGENHFHIGQIYFQKGLYFKALDAYIQAEKHLPKIDAEFYNALGVTYKLTGNMKKAEVVLNKALSASPDDPFILNNLGSVHLEQKDHLKALTYFEKALSLLPDDTEIKANLYRTQRILGKTPQTAFNLSAIEHLSQAMNLPWVYESSEHLLAQREHCMAQLTQLAQDPPLLRDPLFELPSLNFFFPYQGLADRPAQELLSRILSQGCPDLNFQAPHTGKKPQGKRLKIGVISRFWGQHTIGKLFGEMLHCFDQDVFDLTVFTFQKLDFKGLKQVVLSQHITQARLTLAQEHLDVLLYTDLGMEPLTYYLAYSRLAHLQLTTWGHPATSGLKSIDAFISHVSEHPQAQSHYTETLVKLPHLLPVYPALPNPLPFSKNDMGFKKEDRLYFCPQSLFKIHPEFDRILAEIQRGDPLAQLIFIESPIAHWTQALKTRFESSLDISRVRWLPRMPEPELWRWTASVDLILDPPFFGGGNTVYEAMAMGTPVLTWPSQYYKGRFAMSAYQALGLSEHVVEDLGNYAKTAVDWANNPTFLKYLKHTIIERKPELFNQTKGIRDLENWIQNQF